jgi:hypothetical protein
MTAYTGRLATWPSRTFTTIASMTIATYTESSRRCDHSSISAGDFIDDPGHRFLRHRRAVNVVEMRRDLTCRETPRVQRQHYLVDVTETALPFLHNGRAKRALPIPRDRNLHLTHRVRDHRLRPTTIADIRRLPIRAGVVFLVPEMLGHLLIQRGFQHAFREQLQQPIRAGQGQTLLRAWATIAAAATCSGDDCRPTFLIFVHELTASDAITHSAHPTGPQPGVSGRKHRSLHSPVDRPRSYRDDIYRGINPLGGDSTASNFWSW